MFTLTQATQGRAYYEDRQSPFPGTSEELFLFSVYGKKDPELDRAVWVMTDSGPFVVDQGGAYDLRARLDLLVEVARLLASLDD